MKKVVFKRLLCFILSLIMIISVLSVGVSADVGDYILTEAEPNNTMTSANVIYNDSIIYGNVCNNDTDYYKFEMPYSATFASAVASNYDILLFYILNSAGSCIAGATELGYNDGVWSWLCTAELAAGTYYIAVTNKDGSSLLNEYAFYFSYEQPQDSYVWTDIDGVWYCIKPDGTYVKNAWVQDSYGWCYLDGDGRITYNQWIYDNIGWSYVGADGYMLSNQWIEDSHGWCYLGADGYCVTNAWASDSQGWCYLDSNGRMVYNKWIHDGTEWYYIDYKGYMLTNSWIKDSRGWCYLGSDGRIVKSSWIKDSQGWCYVGANGYCVTNAWVSDSQGWCYLNEDGRIVTNSWICDIGGWCYVGTDGYRVTNSWMLDSYGWCYLDKNGRMLKNDWIEYNGAFYYLDNNGYMSVNTWVYDGVEWAYVDGNGIAVVNRWFLSDGKWYYFGASGYMIRNTWLTDSLGWCYVGPDGYVIPTEYDNCSHYFSTPTYTSAAICIYCGAVSGKPLDLLVEFNDQEPIYTSIYDHSMMKITNISYSLMNGNKLKVVFDVEVEIMDTGWDCVGASFELYDEHGYFIDYITYYRYNVFMGDTMWNESVSFSLDNWDGISNLYLEITDYK